MGRTLVGDCVEQMASLPDASVHCVVTSPPYWGLRDYGVPGQIGLEATPEAYVARMVDVFREVRRVLRSDGTLWLNLGDTYQNAKGQAGGIDPKQPAGRHGLRPVDARSDSLKPKDLVGIPWRVALALQADGWYLRQDIVWAKPSPMPESVRDRCTRSHEYVFLLSKSRRYYYDSEGSKEPAKAAGEIRGGGHKASVRGIHGGRADGHALAEFSSRATPPSRNRRSVWTIPYSPCKAAHFAVFPPKLVEPCILAGTSERGACPACGSPWIRLTKRERLKRRRPNDFVKRVGENGTGNSCANSVAGVAVETLGWEPSCRCNAGEPVPCVVLDPFGGSGTTAGVAQALGRDWILCELSNEYAQLVPDRVASIVSKAKLEDRDGRVHGGRGLWT